MFVAFFRTIQFALQNIARNWWLSVVTIFLLILTTFSITLVVGLNVVGKQIIQSVEKKVDIRLSFYAHVPEEDVLEAQSFLKSQSGVAQVTYISQEQALQEFRAANETNEEIIAALDALEENILPASVLVQAKDIDGYPAIIQAVQQSAYNQLIDFEHSNLLYSQSAIKNITNFIDKVYTLGIGVSIIFVIISVIVIFNTIRITIYSHREEVGIMKLVGATNWFIRGPFILEGALLGASAATITVTVSYVVILMTNSAVTYFFQGYDFSLLQYVNEHIISIVLAELVGAVALSVVSGMIAITRHLKV